MKKIETSTTLVENGLNGYLHEIRELVEVVESSKTEKILKHDERKYPLRQVTPEELLNLRKSKRPGFVLKKDNCFFYAAIDRNTKFKSSNIFPSYVHCCAVDCKHLSALSDDEGGCAKVRDIGREKMIEKYDFISLGYESFNTSEEYFVVAKCEHYKKSEPTAKLPSADIIAAKLNLAQFVFPEARTIADSRALAEKRRRKI